MEYVFHSAREGALDQRRERGQRGLEDLAARELGDRVDVTQRYGARSFWAAWALLAYDLHAGWLRATPVVLGGPTFQMMGPTVYNQFAGLSTRPFGAALAFVLMTATLLLTVTSNWVAHRGYRR